MQHQPTSSSPHELLVENRGQLWTPNGSSNTSPIYIPSCWETPGWQGEKAIMENAIRGTWGRVAPINFTFEECSASTGPRIRLRIDPGDDAQTQYWGGAYDRYGRPGLRTSGTTVVFLMRSLSTGFSRDRLRYFAVHEFGHVLGFSHEQDSPARPNANCSINTDGSVQQVWDGVTQLGPWDQDSVMNYCNRHGNGMGYLSPLDIAGVRRIYGTRTVRNRGDFGGDGTADIGVWRPSSGTWYVPGQPSTVWGESTDVAVPGDYNGDGTENRAVWRPASGMWYVDDQATPPFSWGAAGDIPVPADYDADGTTDYAVWRPSDGVWYIRFARPWSSIVAGHTKLWGQAGDIPVPGDYDGDGAADIAIWRPSTGQWYVDKDNGAYNATLGSAGDIPLARDYIGEGKVRPAVWRPSTGRWSFAQSPFTELSWPYTWGASGDIPVPASYSGNGISDIGIWNPGTGIFHIVGHGAQHFGVSGDVPLPKHPR